MKIINDEKSLSEVSDLLHDAIFQRDDIKYDPIQRKFSMRVKYQKGVEKGEKRGLFFKDIKTIWQNAILVLEDLLAYEENINEIHEKYVIVNIAYNRKTATMILAAAYGGEIRIKTKEIKGFLEGKEI